VAERPPRGIGTALIAHPGAELYGSDRVMLETAAALVERGWRVVIALPSSGPLIVEAQRLGAEVMILAVPVLRKNVVRPRNLPGFLGGSVSAWRRVGRLLGRLRPDVVYVSTLTVPLWIARARSMRIPVVAHVHESERQAPGPVRAAIAVPLRLADRVLVNSSFSRDSLTEVLPSLAAQSVVVYNGVAGPPAVTAARVDLDGGLRVAYLGRLSPRKGVDVAVDAIARLIEAGIDAHLDLVGAVFTGYEWYETQLHEQVAALGLTDRVTFHGFRSDVWGTLAHADVAVVPSRLEEPFGNTAVEAVLAGRPVVVSAIGGLAEAIDGFASAIAVPADDPSALADALQRIATSWPAFRRTAATFAPIAAQRYSTDSYRLTVADEITRTSRMEPLHLLAS
jgi:glycosyltransferase involved in cell wall biosynthesis